MNTVIEPEVVQAARSDYRDRSERHARDCVLLALVTSEPVAADLIDKAIELRTAARAGA